MSSIKYIKGNIFTSNCQTIVNTVNCVGVMGAGLALEFKNRFPEMFEKYQTFCNTKQMQIGKLWLYNIPDTEKKILNFPTKYHWKYPSKYEYLEKGLQRFCETYIEKSITSIAFPLLGTQNGGLEQDKVISIMNHYLDLCNIPIEIYEYDNGQKDDLIEIFFTRFNSLSDKEIEITYGLKKQNYIKLKEYFSTNQVNNLIQLATINGIGEETIKSCYNIVFDRKIVQSNNLRDSFEIIQPIRSKNLSVSTLLKIENFSADIKIQDLIKYCAANKIDFIEYIHKIYFLNKLRD